MTPAGSLEFVNEGPSVFVGSGSRRWVDVARSCRCIEIISQDGFRLDDGKFLGWRSEQVLILEWDSSRERQVLVAAFQGRGGVEQ
jgi:hypothetical protein